MNMDVDATEIGSAAKDSGKSLQCTARKPYSYLCVPSGGQNPIANGPIAIFHFRIRTTAESGTTRLRIERAEATTPDSKEETLNNTESTVIIRRRLLIDGWLWGAVAGRRGVSKSVGYALLAEARMDSNRRRGVAARLAVGKVGRWRYPPRVR